MNYMFVILSTVLSMIFGYLSYKYNYWKGLGVKQLKMNFLFGNIFSMKSIHQAELMHDVYTTFKGKAPLAGTYNFTKPFAVLLDLDLVKAVLIRDFPKFVDRLEYKNEKNDPLSGHLFNLDGDKWRFMRNKLTPTFTSGKMKLMFPTIVNITGQLVDAVERMLDSGDDSTFDMYELMGRFTTDSIGSCAFGLDCNSLKDPDAEFRHYGRMIFGRRFFSIRWRLFQNTYANIVKYFGFKRFQNDLENFIMRVVRETVATREKHNIQRKDFINLLIELKQPKDQQTTPNLTIEQMAAQVFVFFAAGFETSSSNMSYGLFELARNPVVQEKLRGEILAVLEKNNGVLTYEAMMEMTYLDQVISETLRKYPALAILTRMASEDYPVPGTNITLEKGTTVFVPVKEIHYDPEIYEEPHAFRPERFDADAVQKRHPQAFLGFGDGPRNCIGLRFGRMQVRIGLIALLRHYRFSLPKKTTPEVKISVHNLVLVPDDGVWLKVERL